MQQVYKMPLQYDPPVDAFYTNGPSLTEQEWKDQCDINQMLRKAARGLEVPGGGSTQYGYDDTTMDAITFRIKKAELEEALSKSAESEVDEETFKLIPETIRKRFGFRQSPGKVQAGDTMSPAPSAQDAPTQPEKT